MKTIIKKIARIGQIPAPAKPIVPIPLNNETIPPQINSNTATIKAIAPIKIHHPIGQQRQARMITAVAIKNFFISV